jgi:hypothetical protein
MAWCVSRTTKHQETARPVKVPEVSLQQSTDLVYKGHKLDSEAYPNYVSSLRVESVGLWATLNERTS